MEFHPILSKLLAVFQVESYKLHCLHTDVRGPLFLELHPFMWDVYSYFEDQTDRIKERALILGQTTPFRLANLIKLSGVEELSEIPDMSQAVEIVLKDLVRIEWILKEAIDWTTDDLVTQNKLIDFADTVGKFRWKLSSLS